MAISWKRLFLGATLSVSSVLGVQGGDGVLFSEQGAEWGLRRAITYGGEGREQTLLETTGTGVAVIDYDNDGKPDLFFVNGLSLKKSAGASEPGNILYRNAGNEFVDVTAQAGVARPGWGQGACVGDYDNDGWTDLYVTYYGFNALFRNTGEGVFKEVATAAGVRGSKPRWGAGCAFVDYDRDGDLDLFVANYVAYREPGLAWPADCDWRGMKVVCGPMGQPQDTNILYRNNSDGTFTDLSQISGVTQAEGHYCFQPVTADFDADGWPDIYVSCDSTPNILYRNMRNGRFEDVGLISGTGLNADGEMQAGMGVAVGDVDHDGRPDILVTNFSEDTPTLYRNLGDWTFADVTFGAHLGRYQRYLGWGCSLSDFDNDGFEDLMIANGHVYREVGKHGLGTYLQPSLVYRNRGDGSFEDVSSRAGPGVARAAASRGVAVEDFNGDGALDIVIVRLNEQPSLLLNRGSRGNWLWIRLQGRASNRSAIGARIVASAGGRELIREVRSGSSFYSSHGLRIHLGLGGIAKVDDLSVYWPGGATTNLQDVDVNRELRVIEADAAEPDEDKR